MLKVALLFVFVLLLPFASEAKTQGLKALIYNGPGTCSGCAESIGIRLEALGFQIRYTGQKTKRGTIGQELTSAGTKPDLYVQPGGSDILRETLQGLNQADQDGIRHFVLAGGHYLGICAGGYLAGRMMLDEGKLIRGLNLIQCEVRDEDLSDVKARLEPIEWFHGGRDSSPGAPQTPLQKETRDIYFQDGPRFCEALDPRQKNFAFYRSHHVAALTIPLGQGSLGLIGPHPEADESWFLEDHLSPPSRLSYDLFNEIVFDLLPKAQRP